MNKRLSVKLISITLFLFNGKSNMVESLGG